MAWNKELYMKQAKRCRERSQQAFAKYWQLNEQLTDAIARGDMLEVSCLAGNMQRTLSRAASAEESARRMEWRADYCDD